MKKEETANIIRTLRALCPRSAPPLTKEFARAWAKALAPYSYREVEAAALQYARQKPFFPEIATLLECICPLTENQQHLSVLRRIAEEAMQQEEEQIRREIEEQKEPLAHE